MANKIMGTTLLVWPMLVNIVNGGWQGINMHMERTTACQYIFCLSPVLSFARIRSV